MMSARGIQIFSCGVSLLSKHDPPAQAFALWSETQLHVADNTRLGWSSASFLTYLRIPEPCTQNRGRPQDGHATCDPWSLGAAGAGEPVEDTGEMGLLESQSQGWGGRQAEDQGWCPRSCPEASRLSRSWPALGHVWSERSFSLQQVVTFFSNLHRKEKHQLSKSNHW